MGSARRFTLMLFTQITLIAPLTACLETNQLDISSGADYGRQGLSVKAEDVYKGGISKVTVSLNYVTPRDVTARVRTVSGDALSGNDFAAVDSEVTIKAGSSTVEIPVVTFARRSLNVDHKFTVELSEVDGAEIVSSSATITMKEPLISRPVKGASLLAGGSASFCAKLEDSRVYCWGDNLNGQVSGDGVTSVVSYPLTIPGNLDANPVKITGEYGTFCALYANGKMKCWGNDSLNNIYPRDITSGAVSALKVSSPLTAAQSAKDVSVGSQVTCAIMSDDSVWCVGANAYGQLGGNSVSTSAVPLGPVVGIPSAAAAVAVAFKSVCAVLQTGAVYCWGANESGQIGNGTTTQSITAVASSLTSGVSKIVAGFDHFCVLITSGTVKCWGNNFYGQIGSNYGVNQLTPVDVTLPLPAIQLTAAGDYSCALLTSGEVYCWGANYSAQLGDGTQVARAQPAPVLNLSGKVKVVTAGQYSACAILEELSEVVCWGSNSKGQSSGTPPHVDHATDVVELSGVKLKDLAMTTNVDPQVAPQIGCAVLATGEAKCWGSNNAKQLGRGAAVTASGLSWSLDFVTGFSTAGSAQSIGLGPNGACALLSDSSLKCWGDRKVVGTNSGVDVDPAQSPTGLSTGIAQVSIGGLGHPCARLTNGQVYCWRGDGYGGSGTCSEQATPGLISSITTAAFISRGPGAACAVLDDGVVKCWGNNSSGVLGKGQMDSACNSTPSTALVPVPASKVAVGNQHACALTRTGLVYCWGDNLFGQTGQPTSAIRTTPTLVQGIRDVVDLVAGASHNCALTKSGAVYCWGTDFNNETGTNRMLPLLNSVYDPKLVLWQPTLVKGLGIGVKSLHAGNHNTCALTDDGYGKCWGATYIGDRDRFSLLFYPRKVNDGRAL